MENIGLKTTTDLVLGSNDRKKLFQLNPREYEHEFDRKALNSLEGTPGLEKFARKVNKHGFERVERLKNTGSHLKVTKNNFPDLYKLLEESCEILHVNNIPDLYIMWNYAVNGYTVGSERPLIVLTSGAVDLLSPEELLYVIGHEVGHIKSGHMLYHIMGLYISEFSAIIGQATLGIGSIVGIGLEVALLYWCRMSEFTADRAGLLACQNSKAAISALMKMSGVPKSFFDKIKTEDFIKQAQEFKGFDQDALDKFDKALLIVDENHPWTVLRASELLKWIESGRYQQIVDRHGNKTEIEGLSVLYCSKCSCELKKDEKFCPECGHRTGLYCIKCNTKLDGCKSFCPNCGKKIRVLTR